MVSLRYIPFLLAPALVLAFPKTGPDPTAAVATDPAQGWSPAITAFARINNADTDLFKRYVDYDKTCGFIDGEEDNPLTCAGTYICVTALTQDLAACCDPASLTYAGYGHCAFSTACVPSAQMASCSADADCLYNTEVAKCSVPSSPYCYAYHIDHLARVLTNMGCAASPFTSSAIVTYSGQELSLPSIPSVTSFSFPSLSPDISSTYATTASLSAQPSAQQTQTQTQPQQSTPLAPILGGAIAGGLAALLLLVAGIAGLFLLRRRRRKRRAHHAASAQSAPSGTGMGMDVGAAAAAAAPGADQYQHHHQHQQSYFPTQDQKHDFSTSTTTTTTPSTLPSYTTRPPTGPLPPLPQVHQLHAPREGAVQIDGRPVPVNAEGAVVFEMCADEDGVRKGGKSVR